MQLMLLMSEKQDVAAYYRISDLMQANMNFIKFEMQAAL